MSGGTEQIEENNYGDRSATTHGHKNDHNNSNVFMTQT